MSADFLFVFVFVFNVIGLLFVSVFVCWRDNLLHPEYMCVVSVITMWV